MRIVEPQRSLRRAFWERVMLKLGDDVICVRCGATLADFDSRCSGELDERCPGFEAIEAAGKQQP
jgi:hypothetical protein